MFGAARPMLAAGGVLAASPVLMAAAKKTKPAAKPAAVSAVAKKKEANKAVVWAEAKTMAKAASRQTVVKSNPVALAVAQAVAEAAPAGCDPHRDNVIMIFRKISGVNKSMGELHRARAYSRAMQLLGEHSLANPGIPLTSADQIKHLKGIGPKLYIRIDEIIRTGTLRELDNLWADPSMSALMSISAVHGIGPKAALRLHKIHGISSVTELRNKMESEEVTLNTAQSIGLKYHEDLIRKIPFQECAEHAKYLQDVAREHVHKDIIVTICGSHRRKLAFSGDIDVLMTLPEQYADNSGAVSVTGSRGQMPRVQMPKDFQKFLHTFVQALQKQQYLLETLALGDTKFMGISKLHGGDVARRVDIRWVAPQCFPTALLYFTGSKVFNTRMREVALGMGYSLSEYGLYKLNEMTLTNVKDCSEAFRVPVATEEEIFDVIGFPYVIPEQRTA